MRGPPEATRDRSTLQFFDMEAGPSGRNATSVVVGALGYRAPEALFGGRDFGTPVDMFGLGAVVADLCGCSLAAGRLEDRTPGVYAERLFLRLGALPEDDPLRRMPGFPRAAFATAAAHGHGQPWPHEATAVLGEAGVQALNGLLGWHAAARLTARELLNTGYCNPARLELGGQLGPAERSLRAEGAGLPKSEIVWFGRSFLELSLTACGVATSFLGLFICNAPPRRWRSRLRRFGFLAGTDLGGESRLRRRASSLERFGGHPRA